ncbi:hypothetical protein [Haloterrigena salinisoli]|uniref:hypothetical protein n=1 Tax=Haloterrigena salinisoli TaxID=3132747 RepID=UPI0030CD658D
MEKEDFKKLGAMFSALFFGIPFFTYTFNTLGIISINISTDFLLFLLGGILSYFILMAGAYIIFKDMTP